MRRRILGASVTLTLAIVACTDVPAPTTPRAVTSGAPAVARLSASPTVDELINALFTGSNLQSALSQWKNIQKDVAAGDKSSLLSHVNNVTSWVFNHLAAGDLLDPDGAGPLTPTTGAIKLLGMIYVYAGLSPSQIPAVPAGWDAGFLLVDPNSAQTQTLVTSYGDAAAYIAPGTFQNPVLLAVIRQPDSITVNTPYPRYSRVFDVGIAPESDFSTFSVQTCPFEAIDPAVNARAVIAHQKSTGEVEYLPPAALGNLTCPHNIGAAWREEKGMFRQRTMQLASYARDAWDFFAPKPLYAGHAAIGGSIESLSPVVVVDPLVSTGISVSPIATATYGQTTRASVTLSVTSGPAGVNGALLAAQPIAARVDGGAPQTASTDANGVATWDFAGLGAGQHSVTFSFAGAASPLNAPVYGSSSSTASFTVAGATLTLVANSAQREYGADDPAFTGSVSGQQYGEAISLSFSTAATASSPVGQYAITPSASAGPGVLANYVIAVVPGTLTITPAALSVTANDALRAYGDPDPAFSGSVVGLKNGDAVSTSYSTTATTASPVGQYPITPSLSAAPGVLANYTVSTVNGTLTIGTAALTITAASAQRAYGDPNPAFTGTIAGVKNGDAVGASYSTTASVTSGVGQYAIVPLATGSTAVLANYAISYVNGVLTVLPASLIVQVASGTYVYGATACVVSYSGFRNGDTPSSLGGTLQCLKDGAPVAQPAPVGTYALTPSGLSAPNYVISYAPGTVSVRYNTTAGHYFTSPLPNSTYNAGRTIPTKFQLFMADGVTPVTTARVKIAMSGMTIPDAQAWFTYSASSQTYQYNLTTPKTLSVGAHTITALLDDGSTIQVTIIIQ